MSDLKNLAMITDFEVERRTVAEDVSLVQGVCSTELPRSCVVYPLDHRVERVVLLSQGDIVCTPSLTIASLHQIGKTIRNLAVDTQMPDLHPIVAESGIAILIINR